MKAPWASSRKRPWRFHENESTGCSVVVRAGRCASCQARSGSSAGSEVEAPAHDDAHYLFMTLPVNFGIKLVESASLSW